MEKKNKPKQSTRTIQDHKVLLHSCLSSNQIMKNMPFVSQLMLSIICIEASMKVQRKHTLFSLPLLFLFTFLTLSLA